MKPVIRLLLTAVMLAGIIFPSLAQQMWKPAPASSADLILQRSHAAVPIEGQFDLYNLDATELTRRIGSARRHLDPQGQLVDRFELDLPMAGGEWIKGEAEESVILAPGLQRLIPDVKTYLLRDKNTRSSLGRLTITPLGITGLLFTEKGTQYIHPLGNGSNTHITYLTKAIRVPGQVQCALQTDDALMEMERGETAAKSNAGDGRLRTYRLAVSATGEYFQWAGSSQANALAYITICINTVNAIFERDAAIRFTIVTDNSIIYTDPASDPYGTTLNAALLTANNNAIDFQLGAGSYDVGILFNYGWSGGLAQLNSVCTSNKGRSAAGLTFGTGANPVSGPQGPVFDATVAHEIAHQFGATHTMAASNGGCAGNNTPASAWEPGGGSTIMAYAGTCAGNSYQLNSDLYFHAGNMAQMGHYANNLAGNSCPVISPISNRLPDVTVASTAYTIPVSTPFFLAATATDADANSLTYTWEQMDANEVSAALPSSTAITGPNFRSFPPSAEPTRYLPNIQALVSGTATPYEVLPSVSRTMNFRVNVRDNAVGGGGNVNEDVTVTTDAAGGPFTVTSQDIPVSLTANGTNTMTITWNVAGTTAAPFNTSQVDIFFSADGGSNFNYPLLTGTANDGTETIPVPNIVTSSGRIMIRSVGNIFFNINAANITIASSCAAEGATLLPETTVTSTPGSPVLNLAIAPNYGSVILPTSGASLTVSDPATSLAVYSSVSAGCINFSNQFSYDIYSFQVNVSGNYIFSKTAGSYIMNLYNGDFTPGNPCASFMRSNGTFNGSVVNIANSITATLVAGVRYTLAVGSFSNTTPTLPFNYTVSLSAAPPGGNAYTGYPGPGAGFSYQYVVVNNSTGNIVEIRSTPDLSNNTIYGSGIFSVYGFSYATGSFTSGDLDAYEGGPFNALTNDLINDPSGSCGNLSKNEVTVNVFGVLPMELLPLTASEENKYIRLKWATALEHNSARFDIEKSADGRLFEKEAELAAAGESSMTRNYEWLDVSPLPRGNFYRIKAVSSDGSVQYSNVVYIKTGDLQFGAKVFPNPVNHESVVQLQLPVSAQVKISVYNSAGVQVDVQQLNLQPGYHSLPLNLKTNAAGLYWVVIENGRDVRRERVIKTR